MKNFPEIGSLVKSKELGRTYKVMGLSQRSSDYAIAELEEVGWDNGSQSFNFWLKDWDEASK